MSDEKLYDLSQLEAVASGNEEFVKKMVQMFLDMTPGLVDRISAGLQVQAWEEVRSAAHKMKPSVDMMGIAQLYDVVRGIEGNAKTNTNLEQIPEYLFIMQDTLEKVYEQLKAEV
jgi:HPt (histidine-containing phosphotransfer) domain-containing protein